MLIVLYFADIGYGEWVLKGQLLLEKAFDSLYLGFHLPNGAGDVVLLVGVDCGQWRHREAFSLGRSEGRGVCPLKPVGVAKQITIVTCVHR